jgi:hypothetical protein
VPPGDRRGKTIDRQAWRIRILRIVRIHGSAGPCGSALTMGIEALTVVGKKNRPLMNVGGFRGS